MAVGHTVDTGLGMPGGSEGEEGGQVPRATGEHSRGQVPRWGWPLLARSTVAGRSHQILGVFK